MRQGTGQPACGGPLMKARLGESACGTTRASRRRTIACGYAAMATVRSRTPKWRSKLPWSAVACRPSQKAFAISVSYRKVASIGQK